VSFFRSGYRWCPLLAVRREGDRSRAADDLIRYGDCSKQALPLIESLLYEA